MTLHRFFLPPETFAATAGQTASSITIGGEVAHQLTRVLRMTTGSQILLLDGQGREYVGELTGLERSGKTENVKVRLLESRAATGEPRTRLTLLQGLLKGEKFDYVLQKGTEVGITRFVPLITERCVSDAASPAKLERWRKIVREAAEQSRRGILPIVEEPRSLAQAVPLLDTSELGLVAWEDEQALSLRQVLQPLVPNPPTQVVVLIGPEGGLSQTEIETARTKVQSLQSVSLGPRILRAETAGPIATALILYTFGDLEFSE